VATPSPATCSGNCSNGRCVPCAWRPCPSWRPTFNYRVVTPLPPSRAEWRRRAPQHLRARPLPVRTVSLPFLLVSAHSHGHRAKLHGGSHSSTPERLIALHHHHRLRLIVLYLARTLAQGNRHRSTSPLEVLRAWPSVHVARPPRAISGQATGTSGCA